MAIRLTSCIGTSARGAPKRLARPRIEPEDPRWRHLDDTEPEGPRRRSTGAGFSNPRVLGDDTPVTPNARILADGAAIVPVHALGRAAPIAGYFALPSTENWVIGAESSQEHDAEHPPCSGTSVRLLIIRPTSRSRVRVQSGSPRFSDCVRQSGL